MFLRIFILICNLLLSTLVCADTQTSTLLNEAKKEYAHHNFSQAASILTPIAKQGDHEAQTILGWAYSEMEDYFRAEYWFRQAAKNNYPTAQIELAELLNWKGFNGGVLDLLRDQESEYWLLKAVKQGCDFAVDDLRKHFGEDPRYINVVEIQKWYLLLSPESKKIVDMANSGELVLDQNQLASVKQEVAQWQKYLSGDSCKLLPNPKYKIE